MICLGIDPGQKRIGLALGQDFLAVALDPIAADNWQQIPDLIRERSVERVYVGLPLNLKGEETQSTANAVNFAKSLLEVIEIPILLLDERLTTAESARLLSQAGLTGRQAKGLVDSESARLLVESAIASSHQSGIAVEDYLARRV